MNLKFTILITLMSTLTGTTPVASKSGLLRKPKVYNAVITTDDNLAPSRAYPLIQPIIHETPISFPYSTYTSSFGGGYRLYDYSPVYAGYDKQNFQPRNNKIFEEQSALEEELKSNENQNIDQPQTRVRNENQNNKEKQLTDDKTEKPPIPLNEFGLPPSLVPLSQFGVPNHFNLQPYPYTTYPLIYDSFNGYQPNPLLPPYGYFPPTAFHRNPTQNEQPAQENLRNPNNNIKLTNNENISQNIPQQPKLTSSDVINYANKNKDIPDVPPPPLPTSSRLNSPNQ